jgi:hypothetical protein
MTPMRIRPSTSGEGPWAPNQLCSMLAPAIASTGTTIIQKYQYSQPATKPPQGPSPARANSVNERTCGMVIAISPSMRMTSSTRMPVIR